MDDIGGENNGWFESGLTVVTKFSGIGIAAGGGHQCHRGGGAELL